MPVLDWTRTDLTRRWPDGSEALAYDADDLAAFDLFILKREGAEKEYEASALARAQAIFEKMTEKDKNVLQQNIIAGLPGRMVEAYTVEEFRDAVAQYKNVSTTQIRENLAYFLKSIIPTCEEAGVYMAIHPDDSPSPNSWTSPGLLNSWRCSGFAEGSRFKAQWHHALCWHICIFSTE